jgi:hypothetical protein
LAGSSEIVGNNKVTTLTSGTGNITFG